MTAVDYDTEFLEDGHTIELISIALVREDGPEYYAVDAGAPTARIEHHPWLMAHVVPHLPVVSTRPLVLDTTHPDVKPRERIAAEVHDFLAATPRPALWAWYGAFDHVLLTRLLGTLADRPAALPGWTNDIRQEAARLGLTDADLPRQPAREHHALADARHNTVRRRHLAGHARRGTG